MPDHPQLDWSDLRYFLLAAQAGTLAGASRAAEVQHTTIGRRLTALERSLGVSVFVRTPEGLTLTPMGKQLLPLALKIERHMLAVQELAASQRNRVRLALPTGFIALFADTLDRLAREHPAIVLETASGAQLADLQRGDADLALRIGPIQDEDLVARSLGEVGFSLYASPRYLLDYPRPIDASNLSGHRVVAFGEDLSATPAARWLRANAVEATVVLRTNEIVAMLEAAASGVGLALLPCMLGDCDSRLVRLTPQVLARRGLSLVYRREHRTNQSVRTVAAFLIEALRSQGHRIAGVRASS